MEKIEIFDPPMCCESGVCGADIDPVVLRFAADVEWLRTIGVKVKRFNLAHEPNEFVSRAEIRDLLAAEGNACLPMIMVNGEIASRGIYPDREELAALAMLGDRPMGMPELDQQPVRNIPVLQDKDCCLSTTDGTKCC